MPQQAEGPEEVRLILLRVGDLRTQAISWDFP